MCSYTLSKTWSRSLLSAALIFAGALMGTVNVLAQENPLDGEWKYKVRKPAEGWQQPEFDDSKWNPGRGGFGTPDTPGARVGTEWRARNIWLRKTFKVEEIPPRPALLLHHDEDIEVYLNGTEVLSLDGFVTEYKVVPLSDEARGAIRVGENTMAVHCRQTNGGQFVDVHLVDAGQIPQLPRPERPDAPFKSDLITEWGAEVTADNVWQEYPRPGLRRDNWKNLNGQWDFAVTELDADQPTEWQGKILVPFALESKLSGQQRLLDEDETLWYHTTVQLEKATSGRTLLNFEAVDYRSRVFVNGQDVGGHVGGNTPFSLDVTDAVQDGANEIVVRVQDATEGDQLNGKQSLNPRGIWYTQVSGIWQTVWMEQVPQRSIQEIDVFTSVDKGTIKVSPTLLGEAVRGDRLSVQVRDGDQVVASADGPITSSGSSVETLVPDAKLWSPSAPHLYQLTLTLKDSAGRTIDEVESYAGIREVGKTKDAAGNWRFTLNGEILFHWGPLDQGWWPDGLLTPPSDAAMLFDIQFLKDAGFNMIRKHIKVEPRRYYYHCDRLGMLVWQDQVSGGRRPPWTRLAPNPTDADWTDENHAQFMKEFEAMVDDLEFHPSIVVWTPYNEAWGQHRTIEVGKWMVERDPSRLVNIASGGNFWPVGDVVDQHSYPHPEFPFDPRRFSSYVKVVGEFGGHGLPVEGHLWDANRDNWGYGGLPKNAEEYKARYVESLRRLNNLREQGISAGVYTQTTDVEGEINGLMTYDRKVIKIPAKELNELHQILFEE